MTEEESPGVLRLYCQVPLTVHCGLTVQCVFTPSKVSCTSRASRSENFPLRTCLSAPCNTEHQSVTIRRDTDQQ